MDFLLSLAVSTLRLSTPLVFAALGGLLCERSGVVNIALEGIMLFGAFFGTVAAGHWQSPWAGAVAAAATGALVSVLFSLFVLRWRTQQIVAGIAFNILAAGFTPFFCKILFNATGSTPGLPLETRFVSAPIWTAWIMVVLVALWLRFSISGLRLQFAGEQPAALQAAGLRVNRVRFYALLAGGALAGLGGASLSIFLSSNFSRGMTSGRGYIALAALVLGKWRPIPVALACLFFGLADALQIQLQGSELAANGLMPVQLVQILPYALTLLVLAGFLGRSRPPSALGEPFVE